MWHISCHNLSQGQILTGKRLSLYMVARKKALRLGCVIQLDRV